MNRLRMERRASLSSAKREIERISTRIKKLLDLLLDDEIAVDEGKADQGSRLPSEGVASTARNRR